MDNKYLFLLNLAMQGKPGFVYRRVVTCNTIDDGLDIFIDMINKDGKYLAIEDDISAYKLRVLTLRDRHTLFTISDDVHISGRYISFVGNKVIVHSNVKDKFFNVDDIAVYDGVNDKVYNIKTYFN